MDLLQELLVTAFLIAVICFVFANLIVEEKAEKKDDFNMVEEKKMVVGVVKLEKKLNVKGGKSKKRVKFADDVVVENIDHVEVAEEPIIKDFESSVKLPEKVGLLDNLSEGEQFGRDGVVKESDVLLCCEESHKECDGVNLLREEKGDDDEREGSKDAGLPLDKVLGKKIVVRETEAAKADDEFHGADGEKIALVDCLKALGVRYMMVARKIDCEATMGSVKVDIDTDQKGSNEARISKTSLSKLLGEALEGETIESNIQMVPSEIDSEEAATGSVKGDIGTDQKGSNEARISKTSPSKLSGEALEGETVESNIQMVPREIDSEEAATGSVKGDIGTDQKGSNEARISKTSPSNLSGVALEGETVESNIQMVPSEIDSEEAATGSVKGDIGTDQKGSNEARISKTSPSNLSGEALEGETVESNIQMVPREIDSEEAAMGSVKDDIGTDQKASNEARITKTSSSKLLGEALVGETVDSNIQRAEVNLNDSSEGGCLEDLVEDEDKKLKTEVFHGQNALEVKQDADTAILQNEDVETVELGLGKRNEVKEALVRDKNIEDNDSNDGDDDWEGVESSELEKVFAEAVNFVECGGRGKDDQMANLGNHVQMQLYGLHKLALDGPCQEPQPMALKISARAKWNAWQKLGSMSPEVAMEQYIKLLSDTDPSWMQHSSVDDGKQEFTGSKSTGSPETEKTFIEDIQGDTRDGRKLELEQKTLIDGGSLSSVAKSIKEIFG